MRQRVAFLWIGSHSSLSVAIQQLSEFPDAGGSWLMRAQKKEVVAGLAFGRQV